MDINKVEKISLLGDFRLHTSSRQNVFITGKKNEALLASILLEPTKRINRGYAEALLWSQRSPDQAKASLRQCLSELRKQFKNFSNIELISNRREISLSLDSVSIDIDQLTKAARTADIQLKMALVDQCEGQFLNGLEISEPATEEWLAKNRLYYQDMYQNLLNDVLNELNTEKNSDQIKHYAHKLLASDNCSELAHASLMKCYFAEGDKARVIQQYRLCCSSLEKDLSVEPSQDLVNLYEQVRTTEAGNRRPDHVANQAVQTLSRAYGLSVAVFPFGEIGDPDNTNGPGFEIASDVRNGLSKFKWMSVSSRYSTAEDAMSGVGLQNICRDINVRYVVSGRIKRSAETDILKIELLDGVEDLIAWYKDFPVNLNDEKDLNNTLAKIICQLDVNLRSSEIKRVIKTKPDEFSAYDCVIRAVSNIQLMTPESFHHAEALFDRAIELDPDFAAIYTWRIYWGIFCVGQGWATDPQEEGTKANQFAREALQRDPDDSLALAMQGHFLAFVEHKFSYAVELQKRAYDLNPYSSMVLLLNSFTFSYCGEPESALERLREMEEMSPIESQHKFFYYLAKSVAYTFNRDYEAGVEWGFNCIGEAPTFSNGYKPLICCLGHLGRSDDAIVPISEITRLDPTFGIEQIARDYPFKLDEDRQHYIEGLEKAGVDP